MTMSAVLLRRVARRTQRKLMAAIGIQTRLYSSGGVCAKVAEKYSRYQNAVSQSYS